MTVRLLAYAVPLALFAPDASAWGLQTHVCLAQVALLTLPFADPQLRGAALRFPRLVLAGACLPDLMLAGHALRTPAFARAHRWSTLRRLAATPRCDADRALALGYASHLVTDVVAHNHFVPEHEARLARVPHATHALAEWAMDRHLRADLPAQPRDLLRENMAEIAGFVARSFRCPEPLARRALALLGGADAWLRASPLPSLCAAALRLFDRQVDGRLDAYVDRTLQTLPGIEGALGGAFTDWVESDPEGHGGDQRPEGGARQHVAGIVQSQHHP